MAEKKEGLEGEQDTEETIAFVPESRESFLKGFVGKKKKLLQQIKEREEKKRMLLKKEKRRRRSDRIEEQVELASRIDGLANENEKTEKVTQVGNNIVIIKEL